MSENERSGDGDANSPTPKRWRVKGHGDDLITYWKSKPPHSNEYAAAEIIEELERELAEAQRLLQDAATQAREVADQAKRIEGKLAQRIASATALPLDVSFDMFQAYKGAIKGYIDGVPVEDRPKRWKQNGNGWVIHEPEKCVARWRAMVRAVKPDTAPEAKCVLAEAESPGVGKMMWCEKHGVYVGPRQECPYYAESPQREHQK